MLKQSIPLKNRTLCILANSKVGDLYGSKIVSSLKTDFGLSDIKLIGNGGDFLSKQGQTSIIDLNDLREKSLYLWRYGVKNIHTMKHSPLNLYQVILRMNLNLLNLLKEKNVYENIVRARPSCIINLDNEHFSLEMTREINNSYGYKYKGIDNIRPDVYLLTNTIKNLERRHEQFFNQVFYTLSIQQINRYYYTSPSYYIGQYGAYEALRFLFNEAGITSLIKEKSILLSRDHALFDIEHAREKVSSEFRRKYQIDEEATVVFFSPGDTISENDYTLEEFRKGYNEFIYKYSSPSSIIPYSPSRSNFKLIVSLHKNTSSEGYVKDYLASSKNNFLTEVIIVTNDENNSHFKAMCASDFGFVYNGQMVSSAAALHLPINTMQDMNDLHYYWHTWENRWLADLNVNADRPVIKEFAAGEFWFGKIANTLSEMHTNTEFRMDQVRVLSPFINEALSIKDNERMEDDERDIKYVTGDMTVYDEFADPIYLMSSKIFKSMGEYKNKLAVTPDLSVVKSIPSIRLNNSLFGNI